MTPSSSPGDFGTTKITIIHNVDVHLGPPSGVGLRVTIPYSVSRLPRDIAIQLDIKTENGFITFVRDGQPLAVVCTVAQPIVSGFDFHDLPPLH